MGILIAIMINMTFVQLIFCGLYYPCARAVSLWKSPVAAPTMLPLLAKRKPPNPASLLLAQDNSHDIVSLMDFNGPLTDIMEKILYLWSNMVEPQGLTATIDWNVDALSDHELEQLQSILIQTPQCLNAEDGFDIIFDSGMTMPVSFDHNDFATF